MIGFLLLIRYKDLPQPAPVSPFRHLDERKASIYENLRDLQFEYRLDKMSDEDYRATKLELQKELARVLEETDHVKAKLGVITAQRTSPAPKAPASFSAPVPAPALAKNTCPACGAKFEKALKFCGECGKPMGVSE